MLAVVALLLGAGGLADRSRRPSPPAAPEVSAAAVMPTAAPEGAASASWYCPGATAAPGSPAVGTVVIANTGDRRVNAVVTAIGSDGGVHPSPVRLAPYSVVRVGLAQLAPGPFAGALVEVDAGRVVTELEAVGPRQSDVTPCASAVSDRWHFADGSTARDAALTLSLFNPFPDDAIADLSFSTDQGRDTPSDFEGIVVPPRSLVVKNIGDHVRRREAVATNVAVRRGRLVAAQTLTRTAPGRSGLSLTLGAPSPGTVWYFPSGAIDNGVVERFTISNTTSREAKVLVEVNLDEGAAEPFELTIPPHDRVPLVINEEDRIPRAVGHSTTVRSLNDVPVVVVRTLEAGSPASRTGRADTVGARRAATEWAFAAGGVSPQTDQWLAVHNVGTAPARVSVFGVAGRLLPLPGLQDRTVDAGRRLVIRLSDHAETFPLPLVVRSSRPVVVDRTIYSTDRPGLSATIGVPLR